ncbi:colorectal cancer-associated protein 2 isoform X1 [Sapajus apella]|uniref:Colorectal cancer-associated protein 2 isoform X1 n=2 Tax=Sapajus apella TaxID=9515 RepID=A0A6J3IG83_SAPAP|nr:colorectal cancer-associated protein 2 isoform X1 [Sapajus apella]
MERGKGGEKGRGRAGRRKRQKGEREGVPRRPGPFTRVSLAGPSPAQDWAGQTSPLALGLASRPKGTERSEPVQKPHLARWRRKGLGTSTPVGTQWGGLEKPKVYQGVRVKITVKELLQQRRAHQAASGGTRSGGSSVHLSDPVAPSSAGLYFEPEPISSTPNYFQPREFSSCVSCEENSSCLDQIFDSYLQTEMHPAEPLLNSIQSIPHHFPDSFQATPFCFNQSLIPGSPSNSSTLSGSLDYSYSPVQLPSYAPENYNSPTSLDTRNCGYPPEDHSYHHLPSHAQYSCFSSATASICYCASCEAEDLDVLQAAEYLYPSTDCVDFAPSAAATTDFYKRETNCDICYS